MKRSILLVTLVFTSLHCCSAVSDDEFEELRDELQREVQKWKVRYQTLERKITNLLNDTDLEERVDALEDDVDGLQDSQILQDERFLAVEADVTDLEDDVNVLDDTADQLTGSVNVLDFRIDDLDAAVQHNVTELQAIDILVQENLNELEQHLNETVGFNAVMSGGDPRCLDDILQFQNDRMNIGQRYDPSTGKFTADRAGMYHFSAYLLSISGQEVNNATVFVIQKNAVNQCRIHLELDTMNPEMNTRASCAATVEMLPGDEVYVACGNVNVLTTAETYHGFTGFLIQSFL